MEQEENTAVSWWWDRNTMGNALLYIKLTPEDSEGPWGGTSLGRLHRPPRTWRKITVVLQRIIVENGRRLADGWPSHAAGPGHQTTVPDGV